MSRALYKLGLWILAEVLGTYLAMINNLRNSRVTTFNRVTEYIIVVTLTC